MDLSVRAKNISASLTLAISNKAKKMKAGGIDVIGFAAGEPDFDTPGYIKEAAIKAIKKGLTKYTPASGIDELKLAISEKFRRDNGLDFDVSQIVVSCGAKHSIYNIIHAVCNEGEEVIIPAPYWLSYPEMVKMAGAKPVFISTDESSDFKITAERLRSVITKKTKAIILNTPSNPTGAVYLLKDLKAIAEVIAERGILVISDEIYEKLIYDGNRHISIASIDDRIRRHTIIVNGVSKAYAMTGWRIGYAASLNNELVSAVKNIQSHSTSNPASISQYAALAALNGGEGGIAAMRDEFKRRRDYIVERINSINGLSCIRPQGAFYVFCRIEKKGLTGLDASKSLLEEARVAVVPGEPFGSSRHIRLSFATSIDNIKEGMNRIEEWFAANA